MGAALALALFSGLSARAAEDGQTQMNILNKANADIKAGRYDQGCADYAKFLAATDGFQHVDSRILLALKNQTPDSELESRVQTYTESKQYAKACIDAYILALHYLGQGNSNKAELYTARALDMEGQALNALKQGTASGTEAKPVPAPPTQNQSEAPPSSSNESEAPPSTSAEAPGVSDWSQIVGTYVCESWGYTGGAHYVGGILQPAYGIIRAAINVIILSSNSYQTQMAAMSPKASFQLSRTIPGGAKPEMLGMIEFTTGSLAGRRALLQIHKQFRHAIIFPADWKLANGKSDALTAASTWCYQGK